MKNKKWRLPQKGRPRERDPIKTHLSHHIGSVGSREKAQREDEPPQPRGFLSEILEGIERVESNYM